MENIGLVKRNWLLNKLNLKRIEKYWFKVELINEWLVLDDWKIERKKFDLWWKILSNKFRARCQKIKIGICFWSFRWS